MVNRKISSLIIFIGITRLPSRNKEEDKGGKDSSPGSG